MPAHRTRSVPLPFDDGFRGLIATVVSLPFALIPLIGRFAGWDAVTLGALVGWVAVSLTAFSLMYVLWTHRLFSDAPSERLAVIAAEQHHLGPSRLSKVLGFNGTENWAMSAATASLVVAMATAVVWYTDRSVWLPVLALATASTSWVLMTYAFALRYLRLNSAGERIDFEIEEPPVFGDFVSMSFLVATGSTLSAATPRTRPGMQAVRAQSIISFAFNSVVVATTVSLVLGLLNVV